VEVVAFHQGSVLLSADGTILLKSKQKCKGKGKYIYGYPESNAIQGTRGRVWKKHMECLVRQLDEKFTAP
jgi:hypothetical protein